jgi:hypothetical protein
MCTLLEHLEDLHPQLGPHCEPAALHSQYLVSLHDDFDEHEQHCEACSFWIVGISSLGISNFTFVSELLLLGFDVLRRVLTFLDDCTQSVSDPSSLISSNSSDSSASDISMSSDQ